MLVSDIYLSVKQELFTIGTFTEGRVLDSELALAFDIALSNVVSEIFKSEITESNIFFNALLLDLKTEKNEYIKIANSSNSFSFNLPDDYNVHIKDSTIVINSIEKEIYKNTTLKKGQYYKVKDQAKINGIWHENNSIVEAKEEEFFGYVYSTTTKRVENRLTQSQKVPLQLQSNFYKPNNKVFISEFEDKQTLKVYYDSRCDSSLILGLNLVYYKKPIMFTSLSINVDSPYSDIVNTELINLVVSRIKNRKN